jgi:hypothetical protein
MSETARSVPTNNLACFGVYHLLSPRHLYSHILAFSRDSQLFLIGLIIITCRFQEFASEQIFFVGNSHTWVDNTLYHCFVGKNNLLVR